MRNDAAMVHWQQADAFAAAVAANPDRHIVMVDADITVRSDDANAMLPEQKEQGAGGRRRQAAGRRKGIGGAGPQGP
jgi:hypothetical protein